MLNKSISTFLLLLLSSLTFASNSSDFGYYRDIFLSGNIEQLEKELESVNSSYVSGNTSWSEFYRAFDNIWYKSDFASKRLETRIEDLESAPITGPYTLLLLGHYYYEKGRYIRGGKWAADTPEESLKNMMQNYKLAESYLIKALQLDPRLIQAYRTLINIYNNIPGQQGDSALLKSYSSKHQTKPSQ